MIISIIIPAYNSNQRVVGLIDRIKKVNFKKNTVEIIVVNDASTDNTLALLHGIKKINLISHKKNTGKGGAVSTGLKASKGDILFIQDDDLEYDPLDIPKIIEPIIKNRTEVVYGSRRMNKKNTYSSPLYYWGGVFIDSIISLTLRYPLSDAITGSKAFTRGVYLAIAPLETKGFEIEAEITAKIIKNKFKIIEIPISYSPRTHSEGKNIRWLDAIPIVKTAIKYAYF